MSQIPRQTLFFFFFLTGLLSVNVKATSVFVFSLFLFFSHSFSLSLFSLVLEHKAEQTSHFAGLSPRYKILYCWVFFFFLMNNNVMIPTQLKKTTLPFNSTANWMSVFFLQLWRGEQGVGFFFCLKSKFVASLTRQL